MAKTNREVVVSVVVVTAFVLGAAGVAALMTLDSIRAETVVSSAPAGRYVETILNGETASSGIGVGVSLSGKPVIGTVNRSSTLLSAVRTSDRTVIVKGAFSGVVGNALSLVTTEDGVGHLCSSDRKNCAEVATNGDL